LRPNLKKYLGGVDFGRPVGEASSLCFFDSGQSGDASLTSLLRDFCGLGRGSDQLDESWRRHDQFTGVVAFTHVLGDKKRVEVKVQNYAVGWR
jgi:hypothetical protein